MHIPPYQRQRAFRKLSNFLKSDGKLVITLRHDRSPGKLKMHTVNKSELANFSNQYSLT